MLYPYEILGIAENADQKTLRKAYLEKIRRYTPEGSPAMFGKIADAYALVKDETARAKLRVFGLPGNKTGLKLCDLVLKEKKVRQRIGVTAWLDLLGDSRK